MAITDLLLDCTDCSNVDDLEFKYYNIDNLNSLHKTYKDKIDLSLFHVNIRSLHKNSDNLINFINSSDCQFDILVLTEIWSTNLDFYSQLIPGYSYHYNPPLNRRAGGVAIYYRSDLRMNIRNDLQVPSDNFEMLCLDLNVNNCTYTLCAIYRHPGTPVIDFTDNIAVLLNKIPPSQKFILIGDCNIDLKHYNTCNQTKLYIDELISHNMLPLVLLPTRITATSETIIDHLFTNLYPALQVKTGLITEDISDHLANFLFILSPTPTNSDPRPYRRIYSEKNFSKFYQMLSSTTWDFVYAEQDPNESFCKFHNHFYHVFDLCFPLIQMSRQWVKNKAWVTPALQNCIKMKTNLYKKWIKEKTQINELNYKKYAIVLKNALKTAKNKYYATLFDEKCSNVKKLWSSLNKTFRPNGKKSSQPVISEILNDGKIIKDNESIANSFNSFFSKTGENLAKAFPTDKNSFKSYLPNSRPNSFYMPQISTADVEAVISSQKSSKTQGADGLNPYIIKSSKLYIVDVLTYIFNLCLTEGTFPDKLKVARVIPLFKKGERKLCTNYRPIALTSIFSKILEKIICIKLSAYLNKYNLIYKYQFGFRKYFAGSCKYDK